MENVRDAWDKAKIYNCYWNVEFSLDNGMADNPTLRAFLVDVHNLDGNSKDFANELRLVCDKHKIK